MGALVMDIVRDVGCIIRKENGMRNGKMRVIKMIKKDQLINKIRYQRDGYTADSPFTKEECDYLMELIDQCRYCPYFQLNRG